MIILGVGLVYGAQTRSFNSGSVWIDPLMVDPDVRLMASVLVFWYQSSIHQALNQTDHWSEQMRGVT